MMAHHKLLAFMAIILSGIFIVVYIGYLRFLPYGSQFSVTPHASPTPDMAAISAAEPLVYAYFEAAMNPAIPADQQIEQYETSEIQASQTTQGLFISVRYAVKPVTKDSVWSAGNGEPTDDGWIRNKRGCTEVKKQGDSYSAIQGFATGCGAPQ